MTIRLLFKMSVVVKTTRVQWTICPITESESELKGGYGGEEVDMRTSLYEC